MKKKSVINLIKHYVNGNNEDFINEAYEVANEFIKDGDGELGRYIKALLSNVNTFAPQIWVIDNKATIDEILGEE